MLTKEKYFNVKAICAKTNAIFVSCGFLLFTLNTISVLKAKEIRQHVLNLSVRQSIYIHTYVVGSKSFRPDIQQPRQMENAVRDI